MDKEQFIKDYCEANKDYFGNYMVKSISTENGTGYVIGYELNDAKEPTSFMIISDKADLSNLNSVVELEPATGVWVNGVAQPATGNLTYEKYLSGIYDGDFSRVPDNAVISIPSTYKENYDGSLNIACEMVKATGNEVKNIGELSFSGSGGAALRSLANAILSDKYPNATFRSANFDAYNEEEHLHASFTDEELSILADKLKITNFIPDASTKANAIGATWGRYDLDENAESEHHSKSMYYIFKKLEERGYDSKIIETAIYSKADNHGHFLKFGLNDTNTLEYLAGIDDTIVETDSKYGKLVGTKRLNLETGEYEDIEYESEVMQKYSGLKDIGEPNITYLTDPSLKHCLKDPVLVSELQFVSDSMKELRNSIQQQSFLSSMMGMSFMNPSGIPGSFMSVMQDAFNAVGMLMQSMADETDSIISFAQGIADMDADLTQRVDYVREPAPGSNKTINYNQVK